MQFRRGFFPICAVLVAALLALSCGGSESPTESDPGNGDPPGDDPAAWKLEIIERPDGGWGLAVWAAAPDLAFAGGGQDVFAFDGERWTPSLHVTGLFVHDVWGLAPDAVYAVGTNLYRFDGSAWSLVPGFPGFGWSIWGSATDDLWVCGSGEMHHWNGSAWSTTTLEFVYTLSAVWGSGPADVFAVGNEGVIYHYDGVSWSLMDSGTGGHFWDVWGFAPNDVWAAGPAGALHHYDGVSWSSVFIPATAIGLWGAAPDDLYALTGNSELMHYDGATWSAPELLGTQLGLFSIDGVGGRLFGAGNHVGIFEGGAWQTLLWTSNQRFEAVGGSGANNLIASADRYLWTHNGQDWRRDYVGTLPFSAGPIWSGGPSQDVLTCSGNIHYRSSALWEVEDITPDFPHSTWGTLATGAFVGCNNGRIYWADTLSPPKTMQAPVNFTVEGLWGFADNDVWAVGRSGNLLHYDGANWNPVDSGTPFDLFAIWGSSASDIWVAGDNGVCRHWDGSEWTQVPAFTGLDIDWLLGWAPDGILAVGDGGLFQYDGADWSQVADPYDAHYVDVHLCPDGSVIAADQRGWVFRGVPD